MASSWRPSRTQSTSVTRELLEWCGGDFAPQQFDIDEINRRFVTLALPQDHLPKDRKTGRR
jgi:hypothetical protein